MVIFGRVLSSYQSFPKDGFPATSATLSFPEGVAVDSAGNLYIANTDDFRIRKVSGGTITTIAGGGTQFGENGPANDAQLQQPPGSAADSACNVYVADTLDNRIRLLMPEMLGLGMQDFLKPRT